MEPYWYSLSSIASKKGVGKATISAALQDQHSLSLVFTRSTTNIAVAFRVAVGFARQTTAITWTLAKNSAKIDLADEKSALSEEGALCVKTEY